MAFDLRDGLIAEETGGNPSNVGKVCAQFMQTSHLNDSTLDQINDLDQEFNHLFQSQSKMAKE